MFQESTKKDVEQYFGILQKNLTIIEKPSRQWYLDTHFDKMFTCIILHNTIIRYELDCDFESLFEPHNVV